VTSYRSNTDHRLPSDFGLTEAELWAEIRRCRAAGWQDWEIQQRFRNPADVRREREAWANEAE
jgi:hypothetical protein